VRVTILGSGSSGNATLLEADDGRALLIDAGLGPRAIKQRFQAATGRALPALEGLLLTHAHSDHASHADALARSLQLPLYMTQATRRGLHLSGEARCRIFGPKTPFDVGPFEVHPWPVPHDAPQVALVIEHAGLLLGLLTDAGHVPDGLRQHLRGCQVLLCESNHDPEMLARGPYPPEIQARVGGERGHLSNAQAAALLGEIAPEIAVLMHLSRKNNRPLIAREHARMMLPAGTELHVAHHATPLHLDLRARARPARGRGRARQLEMF
jgi:phosphoribosyl 1,2-cyclic phosphodiesterase